jgi:hypothetical protein
MNIKDSTNKKATRIKIVIVWVLPPKDSMGITLKNAMPEISNQKDNSSLKTNIEKF